MSRPVLSNNWWMLSRCIAWRWWMAIRKRFMSMFTKRASKSIVPFGRYRPICQNGGIRRPMDAEPDQSQRPFNGSTGRANRWQPVVMTIDYGHTAEDLYGPERKSGTFLCYYSQTTSEDAYERVGQQDMTAHVDFTTLAQADHQAAGP